MAQLQINVNGQIEKPQVDNNSGEINSQTRVFDSTDFVKNFNDPQGGNAGEVTIKSLPNITQLQYNSTPATVGTTFLPSNSGLLQLTLDPKYAIYNGHLYEFAKDIDLIIADYNTLGKQLLDNDGGLLTFVDPNNLNDVSFVQGEGKDDIELSFTFTTKSDISGLESNISTYTIVPWENWNYKDNFILTSGNSGIDNPVTGLTVTGDGLTPETKTITITLQDTTTISATFIDNENAATNVTVTDANTNPVRHKVAEVDGTSLYETVTALVTPIITGSVLTLKYKNENNVEQQVQVDLANLLDNIDIDTVSYNPTTNILTITETDSTVHNVDLSEFSISTTTNPDGSVAVIQEGITKFTISKVGISNNYNDLDNLPALNFDNYLNWKLKVDGDLGDDIISQEVVELLSGTNITLSRVGNQITITATDTNDNSYVTGGSFNSATGDVTLTRNDGLANIVFNLDNRYLQSVSWVDIQNKPTEFNPSAHTHTVSEITNFPTIPDQDNKIRVISIPLSETTLTLSSTEDEVKTAVKNWINLNTLIKTEIETISWEIIDDNVNVAFTYTFPYNLA